GVTGLGIAEPYLGVDAEVVDAFEQNAVTEREGEHPPADHTVEGVARAIGCAYLAVDLRLTVHDFDRAIVLDLVGPVVTGTERGNEASGPQAVDLADAHLSGEELAFRRGNPHAPGTFLVHAVRVAEDLHPDPLKDLLAQRCRERRLIQRLAGVGEERLGEQEVALLWRCGVKSRDRAVEKVARDLAEGRESRHFQRIPWGFAQQGAAHHVHHAGRDRTGHRHALRQPAQLLLTAELVLCARDHRDTGPPRWRAGRTITRRSAAARRGVAVVDVHRTGALDVNVDVAAVVVIGTAPCSLVRCGILATLTLGGH